MEFLVLESIHIEDSFLAKQLHRKRSLADTTIGGSLRLKFEKALEIDVVHMLNALLQIFGEKIIGAGEERRDVGSSYMEAAN